MIITSPRDGQRYGHYQIGDVQTYSKLDLIDIHHRLPQAWKWDYHDAFFGSYDWSKEPAESLSELYKKRAEQLRRDYDYLVLYYSGGYDSANMLYAFLENGIPVDEICVFSSKHDTESHQYIELSTLTNNKLEWIRKNYPHQKIRELDYSNYFFRWEEHIASLGFNSSSLEMFGNMLTVNRLAIDFAYDEVQEWRDLLDQGKSVAYLMGADKPMIRYLDGKWIFNFHDGMVQARVTPLRQIVDKGQMGVCEFFYWAPEHECVQIMIKQSHAIKRRFDLDAQKDFSKIPGAKQFRPGWGWEIDNMSTGFVQAIYPRLFQSGERFYVSKNPKHIFGNREQWFFNSNHESALRHREMYLSTHSDLYSHRREWFNNGKTIFDGIRNCISPNYII